MEAYFIGNILGRLFASVLVVFLVLLLFNKFSPAKSFQKLKSPFSIVSVVLVFAVGLAATAID